MEHFLHFLVIIWAIGLVIGIFKCDYGEHDVGIGTLLGLWILETLGFVAIYGLVWLTHFIWIAMA